MEAEALALAKEIDFSVWGLFARATLTVKLVMIVLILASFWSWSIIIQKMLQYRTAQSESGAFDRAFWSGEPLDGLFDQIGVEPDGPSQKVFAAGMTEWRRSHRDDGGLIPGATARIDRSMDVAIAKEAERLQKGLTVLATVGSSAPFIGLFGTVIGIMNSFIGLAEQNQAVIFYNKLTADSDRILGAHEAFADEFATILSRQLDG